MNFFSILAYLYFPMDRWYLILVLPTLLLSLWAQFQVQYKFQRFSKVRNQRGIVGSSIASEILQTYGASNVRVERVAGHLTDHFSSQESVLRLSESVYGSDSIAALGVAAHEAGHAIQYAEHYAPLRWRSAIYPVARIGSSAGPYLAIFGLILQMEILFTIGIIFFAAAVLFYLVTLPVEFDASKRALRILESGNYLSPKELEGARQVLRAAALTYIASAATAFANFLRLILINDERRK